MFQETSLNAGQLDRIRTRLLDQMDSLNGKSVLVVGDIGLDEYVLGDVRRISPEAPVPILEVKTQDARLGLAANVAQNIASLGGTPLLASVIGRDRSGEELQEHLKAANVSGSHLVVDEQRLTTRKLRVMAEHHHIVRVDYELKKYLRPDVQQQLLATITHLIPKVDAVVIEDYAKGVLSEPLIQETIKLSAKAGKRVLVDPNPTTPAEFYKGADLMTPNREEAVRLSGMTDDELRNREDFVLEVGETLRRRVQSEQLVMTRGKEGMSLFSAQGVVHMPTYARQVFDVTGAGDTVIATIALAWAAGMNLEEACVLANFAAGVVVGKIGCVPCPRAELIQYMESHG